MALNISSVRDTKWLTLEVCRQFQRGNCSRSNEECKFAHPPKSCQVENGRVIACFDSLKVRRGANAVSTCKSFLYSMDVGGGWYRLVCPTPNNIFWIMPRPFFITQSAKKKNELIPNHWQNDIKISGLVSIRSIPCVLRCPEWRQATLICSDTFTVAPQYSFAAGLCWVIVFVSWL